jgi:[acyl-carrier-protein] S-malonyltransferase
MTRAFVFPGQGSQAVGMGKALAEAFPAARLVFEEVDDALGQRLFKLITEGPMDALTLTENAQPALMAVSVAVTRVIESESGKKLGDMALFVAGHSLGEYSALAVARAFTLADTARLLRIRGKAMQAAVPAGEGAMAALLGVELADAEAIAKDAAEATGEICAAANDNGPGQIVVSGAKAAVEHAVKIAPERGAKRCVMLPVSAPFHCALMQQAADAMADALGDVTIAPPVVPVVANVTAVPVSDPDTISDLLVKQVTALVRWRDCVLRLKADGVTGVVELGAGKVLAGLVRRIDRDLATASVESPADIEAFLKTL